MEKLNQIIEAMAYSKFKSETRGSDNRNAFIFKHATLGEFIKFFRRKESTGDGTPWDIAYGHVIIGEMQGLSETFCYEVLWPKLKDKYIEDAVKSLEEKVDKSFKITIESL